MKTEDLPIIEELTPQELLMITENWRISNNRRADLIKHKVYGKLSDKQSKELEYLQELCSARMHMFFPINLPEIEQNIRKMFREIEARDGRIMICPKCDVLNTIRRIKYRVVYIPYHHTPEIVVLDTGNEHVWCKGCDWKTQKIDAAGAQSAATKFADLRKKVIEKYFEMQYNQLIGNILDYYDPFN